MLVTAHSGSDGTPENSLEFVEEMLARNVESIEVDVRRSKKGKYYLSHDKVNSWRDVTSIFMLEELFQYVADRHIEVMINCDLKEPDIELGVKWLAEKWGVEDQIVYSGTVDPGHLTPWDRDKVFYNIENCLPNIYPVGCLKKAHFDVLHYFCKKYGIKTLNLHYKFCSDEWIEWCEESGLQLSVWTVNDFDQIDDFKEKGIYNVTTRQAVHYLTERSTVLN